MIAKELKLIVGPTMIVALEDMHPLQTPQYDALVMPLKIATAMIHWILVDTGNFIDIITLECL